MNNVHMLFSSCEDEKITLLEDSITDLNESLGLLSENVKINDKQTFLSLVRFHYIEVLDVFNNFLSNV